MARARRASQPRPPRRRRRRAAVPRRAVARLRRRRGRRGRMGATGTINSIIATVDASISHHIPPSIPQGAYVVLRSKTVSPQTINTGAAQVLQFGKWVSDGVNSTGILGAPPFSTSVLGYITDNTQTPPNIGNWISDSYLNGFAQNSYNLALHALTVEVRCFASPTSVVGNFYLGTLKGNISRSGFASYNSMITTLTGMRQMQQFSFYEATIGPVRVHSCPMDLVDWAGFLPISQDTLGTGSSTNLDLNLSDALAPILMVVPSQSVAQAYTVNVYAEWRAIANFDRGIQDMSAIHPVTPHAFWNRAAQVVSSAGGHAHNMVDLGKNILTRGGEALALFGAASEAVSRVGPMLAAF